MAASDPPGSTTLEARYSARMEALLGQGLPGRIGIAVSGGGDSTALMFLAAGWARERGVEAFAATIDHALRPQAAAEAAAVKVQAEDLGIAHATIRWHGWDGKGNLQNSARRARRRLLWHWAQGLDVLLLGHTMEDQAETLLRNLARGSGVAGLSGMADAGHLPPPAEMDFDAEIDGTLPPRGDEGQGQSAKRIRLYRPLLDMRRKELRDWLCERNISWIEDPSNDDPRFDRVRARKALLGGNAFGLSVEGLAETARRLRRARHALEARAQDAARTVASVRHGDVLLDIDGLTALDPESRLHIVAHALRWVASADYRPRSSTLETSLGQALAGTAATLHGCVLRPERSTLCVHREWKAVAEACVRADPGARWDRRWRLDSAGFTGFEIRAAGESGIAQAREMQPWPTAVEEPPFASLLAAPSIFRGADLVALPPFRGTECDLRLDPPMGDFYASIATSA